MSPELAAAYHDLFDLMWNRVGTVEIGVPGHNGISYDECNLIEDACLKIERLLEGAATASLSKPCGGTATSAKVVVPPRERDRK